MPIPCLSLRHGIWAAYTLSPRVIGCGRSMADALREWREQVCALRGVKA